MEKQILPGNFIFCTQQGQPVLSTECSGCVYEDRQADASYCIHEEDDEE